MRPGPGLSEKDSLYLGSPETRVRNFQIKRRVERKDGPPHRRILILEWKIAVDSV